MPVEMSSTSSRAEVSVEDLLELAPRLGIPHFQRGLVWSTSSTSALLESLYWDTPCGSFVFWKPRSPADYGVPLLSRGFEGGPECLVVDGQQRIRCLYGALKEAVDGGGPADESGAEQAEGDAHTSKRVWCLNLTRLPELRDRVKPLSKNYALFVHTQDPRDADKHSPLRWSLVPLASLLQDKPVDWYEERSFESPLSSDAREALEMAYSRARSILKRSFFRVTLKTDDVREIVNVYNRINSGGMRVETEERAFARLVSLDRTTYHEISEAFRDFHGEKRGLTLDGNPVRDDVMKRQRERSFGFKTFLRTFVQTCNYHFNRSLGSQGFSFGLLESENFARQFAEGKSDLSQCLWDEARRCLGATRRVLGRLHCDELAFLPEISSLAPFFQLLIQFQFEDDTYDPLLAWLLLALILRPPANQREWLKQVGEVREERGNGLAALARLARKAEGKAREALEKEETLQDADSIQNRYVLLLYWLVRSKGAQDFSYQNVPHSKIRERAPHPVCGEVHPEKQHIIPFSRLTPFYPEDSVRRGSSHRVNSLANFTYISRDLNGLEALASKMILLEHDSEEDLKKHFLWGTTSDGASVQDRYQDLSELLNSRLGNPDQQSVQTAFDLFCRARLDLIRQGFLGWLDHSRDQALEALGVSSVDALDEAVGRHVVPPRRQLYRDAPSPIRVRPTPGKTSRASGKKRTPITPEGFLQSLEARRGLEAVRIFTDLRAEWQDLGLKEVRRDASIVFRMENPLGSKRLLTMQEVDKYGLVWSRSLHNGLKDAGLPQALAFQFYAKLGELFPTDVSPEGEVGNLKIGPLEVIEPRRKAFSDLLQQTMQQIRDAAARIRGN